MEAMAQGRPRKETPRGQKPGGKPVETGVSIDLDAPANAKPQDAEADGGAKSSGGGVSQAGKMTEEAAAAKRLFDGGKYNDAALALFRVAKGQTGDDEGNKQIAQFNLAISLFYLRFYQTSYGIFSEIADRPNHLKFSDALLWLSTLAEKLPEPANIVERIGKYSSDQIGRFNNPNQKDLYWHLNYLLGQFKYRDRKYQEAIGLFAKVDRKSKRFLQAQFFNGISYVQLKQSVPAVKSFQRVVQAIDDGAEGEGIDDIARLRDLAFLSMARTYYSASIRLDDSNVPQIDAKKLSLAVKYWNRVDTSSEYWLDGLFEESWAYFMAGDYPRALGNIHTTQAPYFPNSFYPEAEILRAQIYFATCQYSDATTIVARFKKKYEPVQKELTALLGQFGKEGQEQQAYYFFNDIKTGKSKVSAEAKPIVEIALSDRQLLKHRDYIIRVLADEEKLLASAPSSFRSSPLGAEVKERFDVAKANAIKNAGVLVQERYRRNLDELNEHLRDGAKILIDITAAERGQLEASAASGKFTQEDAKVFGVIRPDEEHVIWPFNGEYWRDELGFYRQVVISKCGR